MSQLSLDDDGETEVRGDKGLVGQALIHVLVVDRGLSAHLVHDLNTGVLDGGEDLGLDEVNVLLVQLNSKVDVILEPQPGSKAEVSVLAVGDIELEDGDGDIVEGVEVKHRMEIDLPILMRAEEKILRSRLKRYYILTTHDRCNPADHSLTNIVKTTFRNHGCQIILNGVYPTLRYYLRMLCNPSVFIDVYSKNLSEQPDVTEEQLTKWIQVVNELEAPV